MVPNNILSAALEASWQASAGICLLLAARLIFGRFLSGRWLYVLWLVVMARLLLPGSVLPESPAPRAHAPVMSLPFDPEEDPTFGFHGLSLTEIVTPTEGGEIRITREAPLPPPRRLDKWQIAGFVWAAGALALAVYFLAATAWLRRRILREEKPTPAAVVDLWRQCCAHLAGRAPTLISSTAVKAPVLIGLFRPRLVLPDRGLDFLSDEDWRHIFFHELAHFRRRDCWTNLLPIAALCLHWFNPLVWFSQRAIRADRELATDELVLDELGEERGARYAETLLRVLSGGGFSGALPGAIGIAENGRGIKRRFHRIMASRPARIAVTSLGCSLLAALGFFIFAQKKTESAAAAAPVAKVSEDLKVPVRRWKNAQEMRAELLAAGRERKPDFPSSKDADDFIPYPDKADANAVLEQAAQDRDAGTFIFLLDQWSASHLAIDWQPSEALLSRLIENQQKDILEALLARRLDLNILAKAEQTTPPTGELAEWLPPRVAEIKKIRTDISDLVKAAGAGDVPRMQELLDAGVDVDVTALNRWTPLTNAVQKNQPAAVKFLLGCGADPNLVRLPGWDYSPLCLARSAEVAQMLKDAGGNINAKLFGRDEPILSYVVRFGPTEVVRWFLDNSIDPNIATDDKREPTLLFSARNATTAELLIERGVPVDERNEFGQTALFLVALESKEAANAVKTLIAHGADPNARDKFGNVPLMSAPDAATVEALIAGGANPHLKNDRGQSVLQFFGHGQKADRLEALMRHGVALDNSVDGQLLLDRAVLDNDLERVKDLLNRRIDPDLLTISYEQYPNCSAMSSATASGHFKIVEAMRAAGGKDVGLLSEAAARGDLEKMRRLLHDGADPNEKTAFNQTALYFAFRQGQLEAMRVLLEAGANPREFDGWGSTPLAFSEVMERQWKGLGNRTARQIYRLSEEEEIAFFPQATALMRSYLPSGPELINTMGETAITAAASCANSVSLDALVNAGGNINHQRPDGLTPLMIAIVTKPMNASTEAVQWRDAKTGERHSSSKAASFIKRLLALKADPSIRNREGKTALDLAQERNDTEIIALFTDAVKTAAPDNAKQEKSATGDMPTQKINDITARPVLGPNQTAQRESKRTKLKTTILPDFKLTATPLREALFTLRQQVMAVDPEPDAKKKGITIVLKLNSSTEATSITLNMKAPTLEAALLEIARQSQCLVVVEPYAIALVPDTEKVAPDRLVVASQPTP